MVYTEKIRVKVKSQELVDITGEVEDIVSKSKISDGICNVFSVGSTASIVTNENEPMLLQDLKERLEKFASSEGFYKHMENAYSHIRSTLLGSSESIPIKDGKLMLGTWQSVMVANFDTRDRNREVIVTVIGD